MITIYSDTTPNGYRATVMLEESGLAYEAVRVDTEQGEHRKDAFLALNPAGAIPVLVDDDGPGGQRICLPQSGAIALYVAEKCGKFIPRDDRRRAHAYQWFYQIGTDITSASSWLFNYARSMPVKDPLNERWLQSRLAGPLAVADQWLGEHEYFADEISVADFLLYPNYWFRRQAIQASGVLPHLTRWGQQMAERPGVARGMAVFSAEPTDQPSR